MAGRALRSALSVMIVILIVALVALTIRQFVLFSGQLSSQNWAAALNMVVKRLVIPFGQHPIRTPYHGVFDVNNALTILVVLLGEWGLSVVRDRA